MTSLSPPRRTVLLAAFVLVFAAVAPATVAAADSRAGGTVIVDEGETTGDLETFGGDVVIRGTVDGDLSAFAGNVRIVGNVTGDVEAAAGNVVVAGTVEGDLTATGGNVALFETGTVGGSVEAAAGSVRIDGEVGEELRVGAESIAVGPSASIGGDLRYDGTLDLADGATVGGEVIEDSGLSIGGPIPSIPEVFFSAYFFLVTLVVGALLLLVFPDFSRGLVDRTMDRPGVSGVVGFAALVATPIALLLVAVTIVGIPLALAGVVLYLLAIWIGGIYGQYLVGAWLLSLLDREHRWLALLAGVVLVALVSRLPVIGGLVDFAVLVWGLGALAMGLFAAYRRARGRSGDAEATGEDASAGDAAGTPSD